MVPSDFVRRVLFIMLVVALALFAWTIRDVLLLAFGGVLCAIMFAAVAGFFCKYLRVPRGVALFFTAGFFIISIVLAVGLFGSQMITQFIAIASALPDGLDVLQDWLGKTNFGRRLISKASEVDVAAAGGSVLAIVDAALSPALAALGAGVAILFAGLYLAFQPPLYIRGTLRLVPPVRRRRGRQILSAMEHALRRWLFGQLISMVAVGLMTGIGLWMMGLPSALALGVIAGFAEFIPVVGPVIAAIPAALLVATTRGVPEVGYIALFYLAVQVVEGYALQPFVHRANLPPVLTIFAIIAFGLVFGPLGVLFATPLAVATMICVRMLYVADILGERIKMPGVGDSSQSLESPKPMAMR